MLTTLTPRTPSVPPTEVMGEPVRLLLQVKGAEIYSVPPDASVYQAIELMAERRVGCLLVLTGGRLTGIVSERDYARKVILLGRNSHETLVRDVMSSPVLFVTPHRSLQDVMSLMTARRVRHLPVLDGEEVVGVVSIGDLVRRIVDSQHQTIEHLKHYIAGDYPA